MRRLVSLLFAVGLVCGLGGWISPSRSVADERPSQERVVSTFVSPGSHPVRSTARMHPCQGAVYGTLELIASRIIGNYGDPTCSHAFPNGLESPVGVQLYYPGDIQTLESAPLVVFTGGILSEPGNYHSLMNLWASRGFVVAVAFDYVNSLPEVSALGLATAVATNRDVRSPLHGKIDLSRTIFAGHSAGGGTALQAAALYPPLGGLIDPKFRIVGALAMQPGPLAVGSAIRVPTLYLTGLNDFVVPDFGWVRWWQYNIQTGAPAWIANVRGDGHLAPIDDVAHYAGAGPATAWLEYIAFKSAPAKRLFVGPRWGMGQDRELFSIDRNSQARALR